MSEENTSTAPVSALPPVSYEVVPYRKGGEAEAFSYTTVVFNTIDAAKQVLGDELVLDFINSEVSGRIGTKARNNAGFASLAEVEASKKAEAKANLVAKLTAQYPSKVIFSEEDAANWKPNTRELSLGGIQKKINKALTEGNMAEFNLWIAQLQAIGLRQQERLAANS